jgi:hypothetical protein
MSIFVGMLGSCGSSSLSTPAAYARTLTATGPGAALPDGSAPVAQPALYGVTMAEALFAAR